MVVDTEGSNEDLAAVFEAAFRAAVEDFGIVQQGFRVDLGAIVETDCTREGGERAARSLADLDDRIVGVLGPQCLATLLGLRSMLDDGMAVITPRIQEQSLTVAADGSTASDRMEGVWRTSPSMVHEAFAAASHAAVDLEHSRGAILHDGSAESRELADAFRLRFEALGGTVVVMREVEDDLASSESDVMIDLVASLLGTVAAGDVDVAFLPLPRDLLLPIAQGWSEQGRLRGITRIATSASADAAVLADDAVLGHLFTGPMLEFPDAVSSVTGMSASQTGERVAATSGISAPSGWWAYAYDAATLLLKAIEDASLVDVDGSFVLSRAELRQGLGRTSFTGLTGSIECTALGDCAAPIIAIREHEDTNITALAALPVVATSGR